MRKNQKRFEREFEGVWIPKKLIDDYSLYTASVIAAVQAGLNMKYEIFSSSILKNIELKGLIESYELSKEDIIKIVKNKIPQKSRYGNRYCNWCGAKTIMLDEHHLNEKETIMICGCCHKEFHYLEERKFYQLTKKGDEYYKEKR